MHRHNIVPSRSFRRVSKGGSIVMKQNKSAVWTWPISPNLLHLLRSPSFPNPKKLPAALCREFTSQIHVSLNNWDHFKIHQLHSIIISFHSCWNEFQIFLLFGWDFVLLLDWRSWIRVFTLFYFQYRHLIFVMFADCKLQLRCFSFYKWCTSFFCSGFQRFRIPN